MNGVKNRVVIFLVFIAITVTIITQLPFFIEKDLNVIGVYVWIPILLCVSFRNAIKINKNIYIPIICFLIYSFLLLLFNTFFYTDPMISCFRSFLMSISMFLIGYSLANILDEKQFVKSIVYAVLIGGVIFAINIKNTVFYIVDLDSITYVYSAKNSSSKIIFSCFVLVAFLYTPNLKITIYLKYLILIFFIYVILIMKSRSTILALIIPLIIVIFCSKKRNVRKYTYIVLFVLILLCLCMPNLPELIFNKIILNNQIDADLDTISSGRIWMIRNFFMVFSDYAFVGGSSIFVENFYLKTLLEVGVIGAIPVFIFLLWFCYMLKKYFNFANPVDLSCLILLFVYYMDGLFDGMAPFGPGAKCFMLWLTIGFIINKRTLIRNKCIA